jgi:RHS repeat-associated protein
VSWFGSLPSNSTDATGQQYHRNRYYNPASGLFTQEDPAGLAGGLNAYGFANGDPVSYSDPFGLCPNPDGSPCIGTAAASSIVFAQLGRMAPAINKSVAIFAGGSLAIAGTIVAAPAVATAMATRGAIPLFPAAIEGSRRAVEAVLKGSEDLETLDPEVREQAASFYEDVAANVGGKLETEARAFNLERARYLREGGRVAPGTLPKFIERLKIIQRMTGTQK